MINDFKIVVCTTSTNLVETGYSNISTRMFKSVSDCHYVDELWGLDGQSFDNTKLLHSNIDKKIKWIQTPKWDINSWTWNDLNTQYNVAYNSAHLDCKRNNNNIILLYQSADQIWNDEYIEELENAIKLFAFSKDDYFPLPFMKTVNFKTKTSMYSYASGFTVYSALKFTKSTNWVISGNEDKIKNHIVSANNHHEKRYFYNFKNAPLCYDMFCFTRKNIEDKLKRYSCGSIGNGDVDDYIKNVWLKKCKSLGIHKINKNDHTKYVHDLLDNLDDQSFGYNCLGHYE